VAVRPPETYRRKPAEALGRRGSKRPQVAIDDPSTGAQTKGRAVKNTFLVVMAMTVFLVGMLGGTALAQEGPTDFDDLPEGAIVEDLVDEYVEVLPLVPVTTEEPAPRVEAEPAGEPEVEVLGVAQERLPVTGSDLWRLTLIGLLLTTLGILAMRRAHGATDIV
jgi:hypothetical protein